MKRKGKWHQFIIDKDLAPQLEVGPIDCVAAGIEPLLDEHPELTYGNPSRDLTVESFNKFLFDEDGGVSLEHEPKLIDTLHGQGSFGGLTEGFSVDIPFTYDLKR